MTQQVKCLTEVSFQFKQHFPNSWTYFISKKKSFFSYSDNGIQQTGLCVSGLSISAATKLVELSAYFKSQNLILNVGSVDILHGNSFRDMCIDFKRLINVCVQRNVSPIITTLAPLANRSHPSGIRDKLFEFNEHLLVEYGWQYPIIDIWSQMVNSRCQIDFECFERWGKNVFDFSPYIYLFFFLIAVNRFMWVEAIVRMWCGANSVELRSETIYYEH